jgi:hypothetical protein
MRNLIEDLPRMLLPSFDGFDSFDKVVLEEKIL